MSPLRSILVHVDASARSEAVIHVARQLATQHHAMVTGVYGTMAILLELPFAMAGGAEAVTSLQQLDTRLSHAARSLFERTMAGTSVKVRWCELGSAPLIRGVAKQAFWSDLLVVGQFDENDSSAAGVPQDFVASAVMASGRPALIVPYAMTPDAIGNVPLIAWKDTREAARALSGAIPLMRDARRIHLTVAEGTDRRSGDEIEAYLRLHGVKGELERHAPVASDDAGGALLSLAADVGADLLIMGCYGHSRARELVLGGASRTILKCMTLPVLMAH